MEVSNEVKQEGKVLVETPARLRGRTVFFCSLAEIINLKGEEREQRVSNTSVRRAIFKSNHPHSCNPAQVVRQRDAYR